MQSQQQSCQVVKLSCIAGNLPQSQSSNGRRLTSSTSLGDYKALSGQGLHTAGSSAALASLSGVDSAQELGEKVWGVLLEGLHPFMHWELQSGMGDFWEQVCLLRTCLLSGMHTCACCVHLECCICCLCAVSVCVLCLYVCLLLCLYVCLCAVCVLELLSVCR